ncbi:MAG: zinc ribbon domain-containing protein [Chloroflexota bacterium]|jgi:hypothetical protein
MSKFCGYCGAQLKQNARFCGGCGARIAAPKQLQAQAATPRLSPAQSVPTPALTSRQPSAPAKARINGGPGLSSVGRLAGSAIAAPSEAGEITFGVNIPQGLGEIPQVADPVRVLVSSVGNLVRGVGSVLRDKKRWIPALVLAIVWFVLSLLPTLDMDSVAVQALSWLTFARGGLGAQGEPGLAEMAGGVIGKGVVAGLLFSFLSSGTLGSMGAGLRTFFSTLSGTGFGGVVALACGTGVALIGYNFMAGAAISSMSMVGIAAFLLSLRAMGNKTSFLCSFLGGLTARKTRTGKSIDITTVNRVMAGMAMGFALSVPLSALNLPAFHLPYLLGGLLLIAGVVLGIVQRTGKEDVAI